MEDSKVNSSAGADRAKLQANKDTAFDEEEDKYRFGCGPCKPAFIQKIFRNSIFFTFILCLYAVVEGSVVTGYTAIIVTTLEKRYKFSSFEVATIILMVDAGVLVSVAFVSYFGERGNKPRWLGAGLIIQGVACMLFTLPHWIFGRYTPGFTGELQELCLAEGSGGNITDVDCSSANYAALTIFLFASFGLGIGISPLFTIGTTFLDDIVRPKYLPLVLGFFYVTTVVGPILGFVIGGNFLSIYVDPGVDTELTPTDPVWVGAWWMPFLFSGIGIFLLSIPFFMFPRQLPNSAAIKEERMKEMAKTLGAHLTREMTVKEKVKLFPQHLKLLLLNPAYMAISFGVCGFFLLISGFVEFFPKFLETQYGVTASIASFIIGIQGILGSIVGNTLSSVVVFVFKIRRKKLTLMLVIFHSLIIPLSFIYLLSCPSPEIPGVTLPFSDGSETLEDATCLRDCNCDSSLYEPVCGADGYTYFSPCRAGCLVKQSMDDTANSTDDELTFHDCGCLNSTNQTATEGVCDSGCWYLFPVAAVSWVTNVLVNGIRLLVIFSTLRIVAEEQRSLGLGLQTILWRLGAIVGPLITGSLFDASCLYWNYECEQRGNCWVYNSQTLAYRVVAFFAIILVVVLVFFILAWLTYPKLIVKEDVMDANSKDGAPISAANPITLRAMYEDVPEGDQRVEKI